MTAQVYLLEVDVKLTSVSVAVSVIYRVFLKKVCFSYTKRRYFVLKTDFSRYNVNKWRGWVVDKFFFSKMLFYSFI